MRILVTGGAGFIGSHTVDALLVAGHEVTIVDDLYSGSMANVDQRARLFKEEFETFSRGALRSYDAVFHFAAQINVNRSMTMPHQDAALNYLATMNLARDMQPYQLLVFASSAGAATAKPESFYGVHKLAAEHALRIVANNGGPKTAVLRYSNVWGPRQRADLESGVVAKFTDAILKDEVCQIHGDGQQTRDFIHVSKVVECNLAAFRWLQRASESRHFEPCFKSWDVGSSSETTIEKVHMALAHCLERSRHRHVFAPAPLGMMKRSIVPYGDRARTEDELRVKLAGKFEPTKELLGC